MPGYTAPAEAITEFQEILALIKEPRDWPAAEERLQRMIARWPRLLPPYSCLATLLAAQRRHTDADAIAVAGLQIASVETQDGLLIPTPSTYSACRQLRYVRVMGFSACGLTQEAITELRKLRAEAPNAEGSAQITNELAKLLQAAGELDEAELLYHEALLESPSAAAGVIYFNLAVLDEERGDPTNALGYYRRATETTPSNILFLREYSQALARAGNHEEAKKYQQLSALAVYKDSYLLVTRAAAHIGAKNRAAALPLLQQALRVSDRFSLAHVLLALCLESAGSIPEAVDHYRRAVELEYVTPLPYLALAHSRLEVRDAAGATSLIRSAIKHAEANISLGIDSLDIEVRREVSLRIELLIKSAEGRPVVLLLLGDLCASFQLYCHALDCFLAARIPRLSGDGLAVHLDDVRMIGTMRAWAGDLERAPTNVDAVVNFATALMFVAKADNQQSITGGPLALALRLVHSVPDAKPHLTSLLQAAEQFAFAGTTSRSTSHVLLERPLHVSL